MLDTGEVTQQSANPVLQDPPVPGETSRQEKKQFQLSVILDIYCCVTIHLQYPGSNQPAFIISQFQWVRNLAAAEVSGSGSGSLLDGQQDIGQGGSHAKACLEF